MMKKSIYQVLLTQFLTAFADNAILFTAITIVMSEASMANWYIPALQSAFLVAFVVFAPWVGRFADQQAKPKVMVLANIIKAIGAILLFLSIEPLIGYAIIGLGAAIYSPAKYGILPEMVDARMLVKANGWIEGSTILAILSGTLIGAILSEYSITLSLVFIIALYCCSAIIAFFIDHNFVVEPNKKENAPVITDFYRQMRSLLKTPRARFSTLGVSLFWSSATVLRVLLVAWAPVALMLHSTTDIAVLSLFVALGIAVGAILVPKLIPLAYLRRARLAAYVMGLLIILLATLQQAWLVNLVLFLTGICGGLFVVPINATLQEIGHKSIGSGGAVAIQNFFENFAMLLASGFYTILLAQDVDPVKIMAGLGVIIVVATMIVSWHLPKDTGGLDN